MSEFLAMLPTQQAALRDAVAAPLRRCPHGYGNGASVHTKRTVNVLVRDGLLEISEDERVVSPTADGYRVAATEPKSLSSAA